MSRGAEAAIASINQAGGIDGRQIVLTKQDNQSDPTRGVSIVSEALASGTPPTS